MSSSRRLFPALAVVVLAAIATGCGGGSDTSDSPSDTATIADTTATATGAQPAAEPDAGAENAAPELLQFSSPLVGGGQLDAATLATKPTAFWFWSPT